MVPSEVSADDNACAGTHSHGMESVAVPDADVDGLENAQSLGRSASGSKSPSAKSGGGSLVFWVPRNGNQGSFCSASLSSRAGSHRTAEVDDMSNFSMTPADMLGVSANSRHQAGADRVPPAVTPSPPCMVALASADTSELHWEAACADLGVWPDTSEYVLGHDVHSGAESLLCSQLGGLSSDGLGMYPSAAMRSPWSSQDGSPPGLGSTYGQMWGTWSQPEFADHSQHGSVRSNSKIGVQLRNLNAPPGYTPKGRGKASPNWKEQPMSQRPAPPQTSQTITIDPATTFMDKQTLLSLVPFNDEGEKASLGSRNHPDKCSPCIFWFRDLCGKGVECDYCHFRHQGQKNKRIRPSKNTRMQMRAQQASEAEGSTASKV